MPKLKQKFQRIILHLIRGLFKFARFLKKISAIVGVRGVVPRSKVLTNIEKRVYYNNSTILFNV